MRSFGISATVVGLYAADSTGSFLPGSQVGKDGLGSDEVED